MIIRKTDIILTTRPPMWSGDIKLSDNYRNKYKATIDAQLGVEFSPHGRWIVGLLQFGEMTHQSYYADMLVNLLDLDPSTWFFFDAGTTYTEQKISVGALLEAFGRLGLDLAAIKRALQEAKGQPQG